MTLMLDRRWTYRGDRFVRYVSVSLPCCNPERNIILYVDYNEKIKLKKLNKKDAMLPGLLGEPDYESGMGQVTQEHIRHIRKLVGTNRNSVVTNWF